LVDLRIAFPLDLDTNCLLWWLRGIAVKTGFSERLQRIMTEKNLTQSDVARLVWGTMKDELGYTVARNRQVVGKYLAGTVEPSMKTKRKMAKALDVPLADLDPASDPLNRPGSGLYVEEVDEEHVRVEVNMVAPKEVVRKVVDLLGRHAI
jgi:transcriptional regulator with XRE-family HTH domain